MRHPTPSDLAVIIPTRGRHEILAQTLQGLRNQSVSGFETVVVADGTDVDPPRVQGMTGVDAPDGVGSVKLVVQERGGPGAARNTGVRSTRRPLVLFLGDDMVPDPQLVERHIERHLLNEAPEYAVLGHVEWHPAVDRNGVVRWLEKSGTQFDYPNIVGDEAGWGRFYSCNVSLKREFFVEVGGFDEQFTFDYEDLDMGFRLNEKGLVLAYERGAIARHLHPYDYEKLAKRYETRARAERVMAQKHPWFSPYFEGLVRNASDRPAVSPFWPLASRWIPDDWARLSRAARSRTDTWYHQQLAPRFLAAWEGEDDLADLRAYLGDSFDVRLLWNHRQVVDDEEHAATNEASFYRTSEMYLYDLTAFAMTGIKRPYLAALRAVLPAGARVLDYGCGIGSDGLRLLDVGYRVEFADFDNPSTRYLKWRLERRASAAPLYDLDDRVPGGFDAAYSFDVIEHVDEPFAFLEELEQRGRVVAVNLLEHEPADTHLHRPLPIGEILDRATRKGLLHYRRYRQNSHLVVYRGSGGGGLGSRCRRLTGDVSNHTERWRERALRALTD